MTTPTRRRGADLEAAIFDATLDGLAERGMSGLTMELVAARAGAGKASLYRRWASVEHLVLAVLAHHEDRAEHSDRPAGTRLRPTGDLREELIAYLTDLAAGLTTPVGRVLPSLLLERERRPEMWQRVVALLVEPRQRLVTEALERAAARQELRRAAPTPTQVSTGPALVLARHLTTGRVTEQDVVGIVDDVLLPGLR